MTYRHCPRCTRHIGPFARHIVVALAAACSLVAVACGSNVPTKPEAAAAVSKAIESTLTKTLRSSTYCSTANPDFTLTNLGQVDLVEMLQNVIDKDPLRDAATAGVVRVEFKEFRFDPAGRSPDPSCDAVQARSTQSGLLRGQVRLVVVQTVLTAKGTASGVVFDKPIAVAKRELVDVTDVRALGGAVSVKYSWRWQPTPMADAIGYTPPASHEATARLRRSNGGWVVEDSGVK